MPFERLPIHEPARLAYFSELFRDKKDFDPELYATAVRMLSNERRDAKDANQQLQLDQARFLDTYHPPHPESRLETETLIPPYRLHGAELAAISRSPRILFSTSGRSTVQLLNRYSVYVYGTEIIQRVLSGVILCAPEREATVIGTSQLDCCQTLAGRRRDGTLLLAHIPGPGFWTLREGFDQFLSILDPETLTLLYPVVTENDYVHTEDAERAREINAWFPAFAAQQGIASIPFLSASAPGRQTTPTSFHETAVTVSQHGISVGTYSLAQNPRKGRDPLYVNGAIRTFPW